MVLAKSLFLPAVVVAQQYAATSPNARPPTDQLREQHGLERITPYFTVFVRTLVWSWAVLEGSVLFALSGYCPPTLARPLLHFLHPTMDTHQVTALTPTFFAGALLSIAGAALRLHCFRILGPHFTFELSIRSSHTLITHGVYGIVRHPSYTGALATGVGWIFCVLDRRGSVVSVCADWARVRMLASSAGGDGDGRVDAVKVVVTGVGATLSALLYVVLNKRMNKEDAMLEKYFGDEWRAWAKRVPYRLVPGVY